VNISVHNPCIAASVPALLRIAQTITN